jgi:hypothetical protein
VALTTVGFTALRAGKLDISGKPAVASAARLAQGGDAQSVGDGSARSSLPRGGGGHDQVGDGTGASALASTSSSDTGEIAASRVPDTLVIYAQFDSWPPV